MASGLDLDRRHGDVLMRTKSRWWLVVEPIVYAGVAVFIGYQAARGAIAVAWEKLS